MYSVENLEITLCGLYHRGIMAEKGLSAREAAEPNEADELLDSLDLEALLQTVRHHAQISGPRGCTVRSRRSLRAWSPSPGAWSCGCWRI